MLSPELTRMDVIDQLRPTISSEQLDRLLTMKFKGKRHFKLNEAHSYEGVLFHEMCNFSVTQYRICEMLWANIKYKQGENPSGPL
ncbi:MAG: hypothetical protein KAS66_11410 [Candidatus Omnitrophica bacterium]|nr:hypothetical protein [Candidatus Omnitrophota bacterium]